jgi:hypothetical protein
MPSVLRLDSPGGGFGVFRRTGHTWAQMGEELDDRTWSQVLTLYHGRPTLALSYGVFQWDGTTWQELLSVHSDEIMALVDYAGQLIICESFEWDDPFRRCLAGWDGSAWRDGAAEPGRKYPVFPARSRV